MAFVKMINHKYDDPYCLENVINYICMPDKTPSGFIGGIGVITASVDDIILQFKTIKEIYNKEDGKQLYHYTVSMAYEYDGCYEALYKIGFTIAGYYADEYQVVYAVHEDTYNPHLHLVINSVSYIDGMKFNRGKADFWKFEDHVKMISGARYYTRRNK